MRSLRTAPIIRPQRPEEFSDFYAASFRRLVGHLYAMTGDRAEAQDAVQEAFVRAWSHRAQLDRGGAPEAWVRAAAWRIAVAGAGRPAPEQPATRPVPATRYATPQATEPGPSMPMPVPSGTVPSAIPTPTPTGQLPAPGPSQSR